MSLYIAQIRRSSSGVLQGYLARGRVVSQRKNAGIYTSPSAAENAIRSWVFVNPGFYGRVMGHRDKSTGA